MAWISFENRSFSPHKMPRVIMELLVLLVLNSSVISCCFTTGTVMVFSVLVAVALARATVADARTLHLIY